MAIDDSFDLEFDINGQYQDDIDFMTSWVQDTFTIGLRHEHPDSDCLHHK